MGSSSSSTSRFSPEWEDINDKDRSTNVRITYVWVGLRSLQSWYGPNHWSVILRLSNGQYACIQKHDSGYIGCEIRGSLEAAARCTWGEEGRKVRLSCYCSCDESWRVLRDGLKRWSGYIIGSNDCQNFAREQVRRLTGKVVGI